MLRVELIIGPMFSGKTTELIRRLSKYKSIDKNVFVIGHSLDKRYVSGNEICTHDKKKIQCFKTNRLNEILQLKEYKEADVIGIDEAQFFKNIRQFILSIERHNKVLIIAGLDGNFKREPFCEIVNIIPLCDSVLKLNSMCSIKKDGTPAIFSKKIKKSDTIIEVGGKEIYIPVCRESYLD